jgi:hypothetical protein
MLGSIAFTWTLTRGLAWSWKLALGAGMGLVVAGSFAMYQVLRPHLGRVTSFAAVCLAWSGLWAALAVSSDSCMSSVRASPCTIQEVGQWSLTGLLFPLLVPVVTVVPWLAFRLSRRLYRTVRDAR